MFSFQRDTYGTGNLYRSERYEKSANPLLKHLSFADDTLWMTLMAGAWKATAPEGVLRRSGSSRQLWSSGPFSFVGGKGMERYITFLHHLAAKDVEFARALAEHAPGYFLTWCNSLHSRNLVEASNQNRRMDRDEARLLARMLQRIAPKVREFQGSFRFGRSRRELLNRFALSRWLYYRYRLLRYRSRGRKPQTLTVPPEMPPPRSAF